jgi:hypothetical protein
MRRCADLFAEFLDHSRVLFADGEVNWKHFCGENADGVLVCWNVAEVENMVNGF